MESRVANAFQASRTRALRTRRAGRLFLAPKGDVAHGLLQRAEWLHVFGRAAGDEVGAEAADVDRQGPDLSIGHS